MQKCVHLLAAQHLNPSRIFSIWRGKPSYSMVKFRCHQCYPLMPLGVFSVERIRIQWIYAVCPLSPNTSAWARPNHPSKLYDWVPLFAYN